MADNGTRDFVPRRSIESECRRRGKRAVIEGCARLIAGDNDDVELLLALGGPGMIKFLDGRPHDDVYWLRVWGIRGLLWAWDDDMAEAVDAVRAALGDEAWRVREMAAKVVAKHTIGDVGPALALLRDDPVLRVRTAAARAVTMLVTAGA